jgi:hypothetical protein
LTFFYVSRFEWSARGSGGMADNRCFSGGGKLDSKLDFIDWIAVRNLFELLQFCSRRKFVPSRGDIIQ